MTVGSDHLFDLIRELQARIVLDRPLVFLDVETTGLNPDTDQIVELGAIKVRPAPDSTTTFLGRFKPTIPISPDATAVHGIADADVAHERPFAESADKLAASLADADVAGYNLRRFDVRILQAEFDRAGLAWTPGRVVDVFAIWQRKEPRDLAGALARFAPDFEGEGPDHSAVGDVLATVATFLGQVRTFWPDPAERPSVQDFHDAGRDPAWVDADGKIITRNGVPTMNVGKHVGTPIRDLPANYVDWLIRSNFPADVKSLITSIRRGRT